MKNSILLLVLLVSVALASTNRLVTLAWDSIPNEPGTTGPVTYRVLHKQDVALSWNLIVQTGETNLTMNVIEGVNFFTVTASNFWGESPSSVVVITPPAATPPSLRISLTQ